MVGWVAGTVFRGKHNKPIMSVPTRFAIMWTNLCGLLSRCVVSCGMNQRLNIRSVITCSRKVVVSFALIRMHMVVVGFVMAPSLSRHRQRLLFDGLTSAGHARKHI